MSEIFNECGAVVCRDTQRVCREIEGQLSSFLQGLIDNGLSPLELRALMGVFEMSVSTVFAEKIVTMGLDIRKKARESNK